MAVALSNSSEGWLVRSDNLSVDPRTAIGDFPTGSPYPWVMQMQAISVEEPAHLVRVLIGGILGCGGWVLSRGANDAGRVNLLFEFERQACIDIYTVLIASGIELTETGHNRFTELCQCTRLRREACSEEIASVDLEIQTYPLDVPSHPPQAA